MTIWLLAGVFLALMCVFAIAVRPYDTYYSPVAVVGFSCFFYLIGIPLEIEVTGIRYLRLNNSILVSPAVGTQIVLLAILAYCSFFLGYWLILNRNVRVDYLIHWSPAQSRIVKRSLVLVIVSCVFLLALFYRSELLAAHNYASSFDQRFSLPAYSLLIHATVIAVGMLIFIIGIENSSRTLVCCALALALVVWGLYSNSKDPIVVAGLSLSAIYVRRWNRLQSVTGFISVVVGLLFATAFATLLFSLFRGGSLDVLGQMARTGLLTAVEPAGPMYSVVEEIENHKAISYDIPWQSVLLGFVTWIPQAVWPNRPMDLSLTFAQEHIDNWSPGRGLGYSPLAEGYLNGKTIGVFILFALVGMLIAAIRNSALTMRSQPGMRILAISFFQVYVMDVCFMFFRGPFSLLVTNLMQGLGLLTVTVFAISTMIRRGHGTKNEQPSVLPFGPAPQEPAGPDGDSRPLSLDAPLDDYGQSSAQAGLR